MLLRVRSFAGYTIDTHESSFWKRHGVDGQVPEANWFALGLCPRTHKRRTTPAISSLRMRFFPKIPRREHRDGRRRLLLQEALAIYSLVEVASGFKTDRSHQPRGSKVGA